MAFQKWLSLIIASTLALTFSLKLASRSIATAPAATDASTMTLQWHPAFPGETRESIETGLKWVFLNLGARLPAGSFSKSTHWLDNNRIQITFSGLGFSQTALRAITSLNQYLQRSREYKVDDAFDVGKYVMLTMNSSYHYYAISEAPINLSIYRRQFTFDKKMAAVLKSSVAVHGRLIQLPADSAVDVLKLGFIAQTGTGDISKNSFRATEFETMQLMPNGQFRFAIYDGTGRLIPAANKALSNAGKPSKCMWCHEINLQTTHGETPDASSAYYTSAKFNDRVRNLRDLVGRYRTAMDQELDYRRTQDHAFGELLYITFMEPSAMRLSSEWHMNIADVKNKLLRLATHRNLEHEDIGELYDRVELEALSPFPKVKFPTSEREASSVEPRYIR